METPITQPTPSKEWQELKAQFEALCDMQAKLYNPDFELVFKELFKLDNNQQEVFNNVWVTLHDEPDNDIVERALKQAGFAKDKKFCKAFRQYINITFEGKKKQLKALTLCIKEQNPNCAQQIRQSGGWIFKPIEIAVFAPIELHKDIKTQIIEIEHANQTPTHDESIDERLDELLGAEAFNLRCSLTGYKEDLKQYGVILCQDSFLNKDETLWLFQVLQVAIQILKTNTDKIETAKHELTSLIKEFDNVFVWGLFYQILILQGLCKLLEQLDINECDSGYNEAQSIYYWIVNLLIDKEIEFSFKPYGENDLKRLEPFCKYLLSTDTGQMVQRALSNEGTTDTLSDERADAQHLPDELNTERANKCFAKAIEVGYMTPNGNNYKWTFGNRKGKKAALGYFLMKVYAPDQTQQIPFQALERLFGEKRLDSTISAMLSVKTPQQWRSEIDNLFND